MFFLNEYQKQAATSAAYPGTSAVVYPMIGLCNEAGEALGKLKKVMRGDKTLEAQRDAIIDELGDVLWYLAQTCTDLNVSLDEVARRNLTKLASRVERGVLKGDGDNR